MRITKAVLMILLAAYVLINDISVVYAVNDEEMISRLIGEFREETKCGSVSVVIVNGTDAEFYGDEDGLYLIGSMTKAFTALAVRKMMSEGLLSEDDKVSDLLPGFTAYYEYEPCDITIEQLLTQTSGYTNDESAYPSASDGMTLAEWVDSISGRELSAAPGSGYAYSNVNYNLLGAVIEQVSGMSYEEYMVTELLIPLGLDDTCIRVTDDMTDIICGSRLGYRRPFEYEITVSPGQIPAGYFFSNASDMARWIGIWIGTADIPEEYKCLVSTVKEDLNETGVYHSGWESFDNGTIGHSGGTPDYSSRIVFSDSEQTGVCVLANMNMAASTDSLCNGIYAVCTGGEVSGISTDVWTVFDLIFTAVTAAGVLLTAMAAFVRKRGVLIVTGCILLILLIAVCIMMPLIFGAGLGDIMFVWAPYSFTGGLLAMAAAVLAISVRLWMIRKYED